MTTATLCHPLHTPHTPHPPHTPRPVYPDCTDKEAVVRVFNDFRRRFFLQDVKWDDSLATQAREFNIRNDVRADSMCSVSMRRVRCHHIARCVDPVRFLLSNPPHAPCRCHQRLLHRSAAIPSHPA